MNPGILVAILTLVAWVAMGLYLTLTANKISFLLGTRHSAKVAESGTTIIFDGTLHFNSDTQKLHCAHQGSIRSGRTSVACARPQTSAQRTPTSSSAAGHCRGMHGLQTMRTRKIGNEMLPMLLIRPDIRSRVLRSRHSRDDAPAVFTRSTSTRRRVSTTLQADHRSESAEVSAERRLCPAGINVRTSKVTHDRPEHIRCLQHPHPGTGHRW